MSHILLQKLNAHLAIAPEMRGRGMLRTEHFSWLGRAHALIVEWQPSEGMAFKSASDLLAGGTLREHNYAVVFNTLHRAVASLEETLPNTQEQVFGPGAVYDFFKALNNVISSAEKSLFLIDPYMDETIFDAYLSSLKPKISVRMLLNRYSANVGAAAQKYSAQYNTPVELRKSDSLHDRLVFVDNSQCWVLGASIKDAAALKTTYLAPLSQDIVPQKLGFYESIWQTATAI